MPAYHYTREAGESGQVLAAEGSPAGRPLATLLEGNHPPLRAAIELAAALADILCIAEEDKAVHGNLDPRAVYVDDGGNVSIQGFGVPRTEGLAPEGRADLATADIYGLGVVLHCMLADEPFGEMPADPDEHDDLVIRRVLAMDFRAVQGRRWVEDVRRFLCNILASHAGERPLPLDAANVLASVADQVPGDGLVEWSAGTNTAARALKPAPVATEVLGGPTSLSAPLARGQVRQAPAAKGESTSFWSREKIAQMLADEDDEPMPVRSNVVPIRAESPRPLDELARPRGGQEDLSAPRRTGGVPALSTPAGRDTSAVLTPAISSSAGYAPDNSAAYARETAPLTPQRDQSAPPPPAVPRPIAAPPIENDSMARPISPSSRAEPPPRSPQPTRVEGSAERGTAASKPERAIYAPSISEPDSAPRGKGMMIGVVVVVVLAIACAGTMALGGGAWFWAGSAPTEASSTNATGTTADGTSAGGTSAGGTSPGGTVADGAAVGAGDPGVTEAGAPAGTATLDQPVKSTNSDLAGTPPKPAAATTTAAPSPTTAASSAAAPTTKPPPAATTTPKTAAAAPKATPTPSTTKTATTPAPTKTASKSATATTTAAAPAPGSYTVRFSVPGKEGRIQCGDGQDAEFVGSTSLSFEGSVTCRITADKKRGAVQLDHATSVSCSDVGTVLSCGGG